MGDFKKIFSNCTFAPYYESDTDCVMETVKSKGYELEYYVSYDVIYTETEKRTYDYPGWTDIEFLNKRVTEFYIYKGDDVIEFTDQEYKDFLKYLNDNLL